MSRSRNWCFTKFASYKQIDVLCTHCCEHFLIGYELNDEQWDPHAIDFATLSPSAAYLICQLEQCPSTTRLHWQGFVKFCTSVTPSQVKKFLNDQTVHLEIAKHVPKSINYCRKQSSRVPDTEPFEWGDGAIADKRWDPNEDYTEALSATSFDEACDIIRTQQPRDWCLFNKQIQSTLNSHFQPPTIDTNAKRKSFVFNREFIDPSILKRKSIVLTGKAGTGKTQFALSHFKRPKLIRQMDDIHTFNPREHDGIVFDDMSFSHCPAQSNIVMLDMDEQATIYARYRNGHLPPEFPRFFTCNKPFQNMWANDRTDEEERAIYRRIHHEYIITSLIDHINIDCLIQL